MPRSFTLLLLCIIIFVLWYMIWTYENTTPIPVASNPPIINKKNEYAPICKGAICMQRVKKTEQNDGDLFSVFDNKLNIHFLATLYTEDGFQEQLQKTPDNKYTKIRPWWPSSWQVSYQYFQIFNKDNTNSLSESIKQRFIWDSSLCALTTIDWWERITYTEQNDTRQLYSTNPITSGNCMTEYTNTFNYNYFQDLPNTNLYVFYNRWQEWAWFSHVVSLYSQ